MIAEPGYVSDFVCWFLTRDGTACEGGRREGRVVVSTSIYGAFAELLNCFCGNS